MKTIIFDLGNVLLSFHPEEYLLQHFDQTTMEDLLIIIFCSDEWVELDLGNLTIDEVIDIFSKRNPQYTQEISFVLKNWTEMLKPIKKNIDILKRLKSLGYPLYYLSNFHKEAFEKMFTQYDFFKLFDGGVVSAYEHTIKPNYKLYEILLVRYSLNPKECLFIDDTLMNIRSANELGMDGIELCYGVELKDELLKKGIEI